MGFSLHGHDSDSFISPWLVAGYGLCIYDNDGCSEPPSGGMAGTVGRCDQEVWSGEEEWKSQMKMISS